MINGSRAGVCDFVAKAIDVRGKASRGEGVRGEVAEGALGAAERDREVEAEVVHDDTAYCFMTVRRQGEGADYESAAGAAHLE